MDLLPSTAGTPKGVQPFLMLIFLLAAVLLGSLMGSAILLFISEARGMNMQTMLGSLDEDSPLSTRQFFRLANLISHFLTFTVSSLAVVILTFRRHWLRWLQLDSFPGLNILLASVVFIIAAFPVAQTTYWINQQLPLPGWAVELEQTAMNLLRALLIMESPSELLFNLLVMAFIPALGEELLFRGVVQQNIERWSGRPLMAIWLTALFFSLIHMQFEGFLPRLLLGAALGYLLVWTRNLWVPIAAHLVFNGSQVIAQYVAGDSIKALDSERVEDPGWLACAAGLLVLGAMAYYIRRNSPDQPLDEHANPEP